jgi:hypothetical protein
LTTATIGSEGGSIGTDDVTITIPAGAFQSNAELQLLKSGEENTFDNNAVSDIFIIDGLPTEFNNPIEVKIKYNGTITDSAFVAFGEDVFVKSLDTNKTCYSLLSAKDSSGYLIASIPALSSEKNSNFLASNKDDNLALNLVAVCGYATYVSQQGHFKINFPASVLTQTYDLADYLENAYSKFLSIGFSYGRRTKWPVEVTVKRLKSSVFGYTTNSAWGDNYGYMEFNFDKMDDAADMKVTAGHEFFHLIQAFYDNRNRYYKAKYKGPNFWLYEASSVWSEEFFSGSGPNYVSPVFADNAMDILQGAKTGDADKADAEAYGYGMAGFIKYFTKTEGVNALADVYENLYNNYKPFQALSRELPLNISYSWHLFLQDYFTFSLYKGGNFTPVVLLSQANDLRHKFEIKNSGDTEKTFNVKLSDLSAAIFSVQNRYAGLKDDAQIVFDCNGAGIQLFKVNGEESIFLQNGTDVLTLEGFKKIADDGYQVIAVAYNDDCTSPYTNEKSLEMKIQVINNTSMTFNYLNFLIKGQGYFEVVENGTVSSHYSGLAYIQSVSSTDIQTISVAGNTISCTADFGSPKHYNYSVTLVLDNVTNPTVIKEFHINFKETNNSPPYTSTRIKSAEGTDIQLQYNNENEILFKVKGDITGNLSDYSEEYSYTQNGLTHTETLLNFDGSDGEIYFILRK